MQQIADALETHTRGKGYTPTGEQVDEVTGIGGRCRPILLPNRPLKRRFDPLRVLEGLGSGLPERNASIYLCSAQLGRCNGR